MKKYFFLFLTMCLVATASAQEKRLYVGPRVGVNFTGITNSNMDTWRVGASAGGFAMYRFNDYVGVEGDILFSMMGAKYDDFDVRLNYLAIPMLARIYMLEGLNLQVGPQIGFKVYDKIKIDDLGSESDSKIFNSVDLSFVLGLGYEFKCGALIDFRYGVGLTNPIKSEFNDDEGSSNQLLQLSVGWKF